MITPEQLDSAKKLLQESERFTIRTKTDPTDPHRITGKTKEDTEKLYSHGYHPTNMYKKDVPQMQAKFAIIGHRMIHEEETVEEEPLEKTVQKVQQHVQDNAIKKKKKTELKEDAPAANPDYEALHKRLTNQGFNLTGSKKIDTRSNSTKDFTRHSYEHPTGGKKSVFSWTNEHGASRALLSEDVLQERHMSSSEKGKRERIVKKLKKHLGNFTKEYGEKGKNVMYAVATKRAMNEDGQVANNSGGRTLTGQPKPQIDTDPKMKPPFMTLKSRRQIKD